MINLVLSADVGTSIFGSVRLVLNTLSVSNGLADFLVVFSLQYD